MNDKVSIIVPMYNVASYVEKCFNSMAAQRHENIEIIVIDDASTDRSGAIADEFAARDSRFKVVHMISNVGSSSARNAGLDLASGNYVAFVDSDDFVDDDFISTMLAHLLERQADICVCNFLIDEKPAANWTATELSGDDIWTAYIAGDLYTRVFNKIYSRDVIGNVKFPPERDLMEDGVWTPKVLLNAGRVCRIVDAPYHYRVRSDGLMRKRRTLKEYVGYYTNTVEQYFILFDNVNRESDLRILTVEFIKTVLEFLRSDIVDVKEIFTALQLIAYNFRPKMLPPDPQGKIFLRLLNARSDARSFKELLQSKGANV